jgi:hypothetical protein
MALLGRLWDSARDAVSQAVEAQRFISRHKLVKDPEIPGRYYLSQARDRFIDADLSDPEVRERAEETIREFRTDVRVRKNRNRGKKEEAAAPAIDTSCLRFIPPGQTPSSPSLKGKRR